MGEKAIEICAKRGPKYLFFGPKVDSEGATVLGVSFWRFGVPFGARFGFFCPFRVPFSGCFSEGVWGALGEPGIIPGRIGGG